MGHSKITFRSNNDKASPFQTIKNRKSRHKFTCTDHTINLIFTHFSYPTHFHEYISITGSHQLYTQMINHSTVLQYVVLYPMTTNYLMIVPSITP
jgi:hypothetical protein